MSQNPGSNNTGYMTGTAKSLLNMYPKSRIFTFKGELGAGKTTLIKALCRELKVVGLTNSPSFSIVNEYPTAEGDLIYHFDFYRIKNIAEIFDIGYEEYFYSGHYCFIEWPEVAEQIIPTPYVEVEITLDDDKQTRVIAFSEKKSVV
ncbi:MAG TPA: tRNA (adenosine(37)-N6)-threonylcarbamoyltransferase complex ATPase subunit type 1 TsaE [Bacteroidales bacterium]|nr:tRNA (adenosine(37)-N6)-threonylcarbamoyltransferase complex ATPase subunit type 1 TsaE [Bacteroidales bacterium]